MSDPAHWLLINFDWPCFPVTLRWRHAPFASWPSMKWLFGSKLLDLVFCWASALAGRFGYWHKSGEERGVERKGTIIQMPSIFRQEGRWMEERWDRGRKTEIKRIERERKNKGERRGRHRGFKGLMAICTAHWSGGTTLATLAQPRKSYSYMWRFISRISCLGNAWSPASSAWERCFDWWWHRT